MDKIKLVKKIFLWAFTLAGLITLMIGSVGLLNIGLRTYVFTKADNDCYIYNYPETPKGSPTIEQQQKQCEDNATSQKQRDAAQDVSLVLVGGLVFAGFYRNAKK